MIEPIAKSVLIPLWLIAAAVDAEIQKKLVSGTTALIISIEWWSGKHYENS